MCIVHKHHCEAGDHTWYEQVDCGEVNLNMKCHLDLPELKDQGSKAFCKLHSKQPTLPKQQPIRNTYDIAMSLKCNRMMPDTYPTISASQPASPSMYQFGRKDEGQGEQSSRAAEMISATEYDYPWPGEMDAEFIERVLLKRRRMSAKEAFKRLDLRKQEKKWDGKAM
jgi:hypothetical protein